MKITNEQVAGLLDEVRARHPLVHNITNYVVMNSTANILLALGASPVMAHAEEEAADMAALAGALVLNIGTLSSPWIRAMINAGKAARAKGIPVVLDPVGVGATRFRTETALRLLDEVGPAVIRGNASEILALSGAGGGARGVDSLHSVEQAREAARTLAAARNAVVAVTGAEDFITDGCHEAYVGNGHPLMARVTGTGCAASAVTGAFCAVSPAAPFLAAVSALVVFGLAGENAAHGQPRPGTYGIALIDGIDEVTAAQVIHGARMTQRN